MFDDDYVENKLSSIYPETLASLNVTSRLRQLCMQETDKMDTKKLLDFLDNFIAIFRHNGSEFKSKYKNDAEQWHKALCKLFCQLIRPSDLPSRMNIDGLHNFTVLQNRFRKKGLQHQNFQQLSGKSASSTNEKTVSCRIVELHKALYDLPKASQYFEEVLSKELNLDLSEQYLIKNYLYFVKMVQYVTSLLMLMIFLLLALKVLNSMIRVENNFLMSFNLFIDLNHPFISV